MNAIQPIQAGYSAGAELRPKPNANHHILVADDEEVLRRLLAKALTDCGYEVDAAEDGAVAWSAIQSKHYDLLITDNSMPVLTGIGLVKILRDHGLTLPVIMATGAHPSADLERYPWLGIDAILLKPYLIEDLLKAVKRTLCEADAVSGSQSSRLSPDPKNDCLSQPRYATAGNEEIAFEEPLPSL